MVSFILRRVVGTVGMLVVAAVGTFLLMRLVPADPVRLVVGMNASREQVEAARERLGLSEPLYVQLWRFLSGLVKGDFGTSLVTHREVASDIVLYFPATLELVAFAITIAVVIAFPLGLYTVRGRPRFLARLGRLVAFVAMGLPSFILALVLQVVIFGQLGWAPIGGRVSGGTPDGSGILLIDFLFAGDLPGFLDALHHLILPAVSLAIPMVGLLVRFIEVEYERVLHAEHIRIARAKGASGFRLFKSHVLRNMMPAVLTIVGMLFGWSLAGSVLVESIFSWPGLGQYVMESLRAFDYYPVIISTLFLAAVFALINLAVDIAQAIIDPRVRITR